jgi:hypothetical protein
MIKRTLYFCFLVNLLNSFSAFAQDDLLMQLQKDQKPVPEKVLATFKGNKIINIQTNETVKKKNLDFRVNHLFGNIGNESGGGIHTLYGLDQSSDIRIGFHYGISDKLTAGMSRSKRNENLEGLLKYRLLEQSTDNKMPFAITVFGNATLTTKSDELVDKFEHRFTYCAQAILARKFSSHFSLEVVPSYLHRNFVPEGDENDLFSVGAGARYKLTRSASVIADYFYIPERKNLAEEHFSPIGIGFEIETGGHVFSLMFTNASGIIENDFLANTVDDWGKGGIKFTFIISRMFNFGKLEK